MKILLAFISLISSAYAERPNILFILADDIGYGDLGCYGGTHAKTPNLDRLAREGMRFTDAHSPASTCSPTRRALLTGVYSWRQEPSSGILPGDAPLGITPGTPTLASLLKQADYTTGVVGKWHIGLGGPADPQGKGPAPNWNNEIKPGPLELGFDYAYIMAATGDRVPTVYVENHRIVDLDPADPISVSYEKKVGTLPTGSENSELLSLKHTHGHDMTIVNGVGRIGWMTGGKSALWRDQDMADVFARKSIQFIDQAVAKKDKPFFLYLATHGIHVPRVPNERFKGITGKGARADAICELDDTIGQVISALEKNGQLDNTLIMFSSDNGGTMDDGYEDFAPGDYAMNGILRGKKGQLLEGGHRVPFIARWPGKIPAGKSNPALIAHLDLPATLAALTGVCIPNSACRDSENFLSALLGQSESARIDFIAHIGGTRGPFAVRSGSWKWIQPSLISEKNSTPSPDGYLFDLSTDLAETNNLATAQPAKVTELAALLEASRAEKPAPK